jgi:hypothetical protein
MRRGRVVIAVAVLIAVVLVLGAAWIDGGREPVRPIVEPVPLPAVAR